MTYDPNNIFAKILRKDIPCKIVYENDYACAFFDLHPQAPLHILVIPKGPYINSQEFHESASPEEISGFYRAIAQVAKDHHLTANGFRLITNNGLNAGQEVPHYHIHLLGGGPLGPMMTRKG